MIFHISTKVKDRLKIAAFSEPDTPVVNKYCEWCVDIFEAKQKQYFIAANTYSMAGFCFPAKGILNQKRFESAFSESLQSFLASMKLSHIFDEFILQNLENSIFCKNESIKLRSALNQKKEEASYALERKGTISETNRYCFDTFTSVFSDKKNNYVSTKKRFLASDMKENGILNWLCATDKANAGNSSVGKKTNVTAITFTLALNDFKPGLTRTFIVSEKTKMSMLGYAIIAMINAQGSHLFNFEITQGEFHQEFMLRMADTLPPNLKDDFEAMENTLRFLEANSPATFIELPDSCGADMTFMKKLDARKVTVDSIFADLKTRCKFTYDFGDNWEFVLTPVEKIETDKVSNKIPVCVLDGKGCGIIEDCGGVPGLEHILEVLKKKKGEEYNEITAWLGGSEFDFADFNAEAINKNMGKMIKNYKLRYEEEYYS